MPKAKEPKLTPKQEAFCLAYIETGNASEAYRQAYNVSRMKPETVNRCAKELLDNPKITARIQALRASAAKKAQFTLESHIETLKELRDEAKALGQMSAAIQAETQRGKAAGFYVEKKAFTDSDGNPIGVPQIAINFVQPQGDDGGGG